MSESYKSYRPAVDLVPCVQRLLASVGDHHLKALESIVLTDAESIGRGKTQRIQGKKYLRRECRGFYHPAHQGGRAWIELTIDQIFKGIPPGAMDMGLVQDAMLADVLFHEIGHHIEFADHAADRRSEARAERWKRTFKRQYMRKHHWWLILPSLLLRPVFRGIGKIRNAANKAL